jgi:hypothetical protein
MNIHINKPIIGLNNIILLFNFQVNEELILHNIIIDIDKFYLNHNLLILQNLFKIILKELLFLIIKMSEE